MAAPFDPTDLIHRLDPVKYEGRSDDEQASLDQMSLAGVLLALTELDHAREYELCRNVAKHLLGQVNEPEDIVLE